jgi:hypothetical protein
MPIVTSNVDCYFEWRLLLRIPIGTLNTKIGTSNTKIGTSNTKIGTSNTNCYFKCRLRIFMSLLPSSSARNSDVYLYIAISI